MHLLVSDAGIGGGLPEMETYRPESNYDVLYADVLVLNDDLTPSQDRDGRVAISDGFASFRWAIQASASPRR
jgi:hypothetical protein